MKVASVRDVLSAQMVKFQFPVFS